MFNETNIWQNHSTACYDIKRSNSTMSTAKPQSTTITLYFTHPTILIRSSLSITFLIISPRGVAKSQLIRPFAQQNKELPLLLGDWRLTTPTASLSPRFSLSRSARYNASAAYSGEKPWHAATAAAGGQENRFSFRPNRNGGWNLHDGRGRYIGLRLGADLSPNLSWLREFERFGRNGTGTPEPLWAKAIWIFMWNSELVNWYF